MRKKTNMRPVLQSATRSSRSLDEINMPVDKYEEMFQSIQNSIFSCCHYVAWAVFIYCVMWMRSGGALDSTIADYNPLKNFHLRSLMSPLSWFTAQDNGPAIDGGGWKLVRRVKRGQQWHPASDDLAGKDEYGVATEDYKTDTTFSVPFEKENYDEVLLCSGDLSQWMIVKKEELGKQGENFGATVQKSYLNENVYTATWFNRPAGFPEDPWISAEDHPQSILYGEASFGPQSQFYSPDRSAVLTQHEGAAVFIREKTPFS